MKDRVAGVGQFLKRQWIMIWLISAIVGLTSIVVYGVYTEGVFKMKRVVAPASEMGGLFTSNHLILGGGSKSVYYREDAVSPYTFPLEIRNFNPNDPNTKYPGEIKYSLRASLAHMSLAEYKDDDPSLITNDSDWVQKGMSITVSLGDKIITLSGNKLSDELGTAEDEKFSLTNEHDRDNWTVSFNNIPLGTDYCVLITAIPLNQDLSEISQVLAINAVPEVYTEGWSCSIADDMSKTVDCYDAFNYTISGTGRKTLKFSYDADKLEINPTFYEYITEASSGIYSGSTTLADRSNWKTITIEADPDTTLVNRYDFQMYKKVEPFQPNSFDELKPSSPITSVSEGGQIPTVYIEFEEVAPTP